MSNPPVPPIPPTPQQYPYPYPQAQPYAGYNPYALSRPQSGWCRTAGLFQIILGSLMALLSFCLLAFGAMVAAGAIPPEQLSEIQGTSEFQGQLHVLALVMGALVAVLGVAYIILGIFVWRRSLVTAIISMVVTSVLLLLSIVGIAVALIARTERAPEATCSNGLPLLVFLSLLWILIMAIRDLRRGDTAMAQYQQQWQQYYHAYYQAAAAQQAPPPVGPAIAPPPPASPLSPPASAQEPPPPPASQA